MDGLMRFFSPFGWLYLDVGARKGSLGTFSFQSLSKDNSVKKILSKLA